MNASPGSFELLASRVDQLEKRVHTLEHPSEDRTAAANLPAVSTETLRAVTESPLETTNILPGLGRAMLGIAGAYVLRAIAEARLMPTTIAAAIAIAYAFAWLTWSARASRVSGLVPLLYAGTSAAVLVPMLWEETLHFHAFAPIATASVLAAFAVFASALEWRRDTSLVLWLVYGAATATAITLSVATHQMLPFVFTVLVMVALCEAARALKHARPMWPLVVLASDAAIWAMIFIYTGPQSARADYPEVSVAALVIPPCLLLAINATGVAVLVVLRERKITAFETIQIMIAFGLVASGFLLFAPTWGSSLLGVSCLILASAMYIASFKYLLHHAAPRNVRVLSSWSAGLFLAGSIWALPQPGAAIVIALAAGVAYTLAARINSRILEVHGAVFLVTATVIAGVPQYVFGALAGALPTGPPLALWIIASAAVGAYVFDPESREDIPALQMLHLVPALLAATLIAAVLVHGMLALASTAIALDVHHIALLRTLVVSAISLCLGYTGSRWERVAMTRVAYIALAFVGAKLGFEDLRHGHMQFIAGSIFVFAISLIAVPRLARMGAKSRVESHAEILIHTRG